jgi:hypothetical protein
MIDRGSGEERQMTRAASASDAHRGGEGFKGTQLSLVALRTRRRRSIRPAPSIEKAWQIFRRNLAAALGDLEEDEHLILSHKRSNYFVQFAAQGALGMRAEAVSNTYIAPLRRLAVATIQALRDLGWNPPTYVPQEGIPEPANGSPNYYIDAAAPVPFRKLALLALDTLRDVYRVRHPGELQYVAFSDQGVPIRFPLLGIKRGAR